MTILEDLQRASFRGAPFYYISTIETGGFKVAEHLYPGSDNFVIEQLGKVPKRYSMDIRLTSDQKQRFDIALDTEGSGRLSHPLLGNAIVKVIRYTSNDNINSLNFYEYTVEFVVEVGPIEPIVAGVFSSIVSRAEALVFENVKDFVNDTISPRAGGFI